MNSPIDTEKTTDKRHWTVSLHDWRRRNIPEYAYLVFLAIIVGILAGLATHIFRYSISYVAGHFTKHISDTEINWWLIGMPVAGILITGIFTRYIIHTNLTHGVAQLIRDIKNRMFRIKHNITFSPMVGGTITLGMGGSSGSEGPIAYTGAAIGSNVGQFLGLDPKHLKILTGCGASAAICGIFMSPVGGLMFSLELLMIPLTTLSVMALMVSCLVSYAVVFLCRGFVFDHTYCPIDAFDNNLIPAVIGLAIFCGLYCVYYSSVVNGLDSVFKKIRSPWVSNIFGGLIVGLCLLLFPSMYGVGYPVIGEVIHNNVQALSHGTLFQALGMSENGLMVCAAAILALKCWAVAATNSSGGVGGDFSPTLFAGAISGFLYASLCNHIFGWDLPLSVFAFLGMAGVMSAAIEAPLMTIFIVMDLGQSYTYAAPIGICSIISFLTVKGGMKLLGKEHNMVRHVRFFNRSHS